MQILGKHKLGIRAGKYKLGIRAGKYKFGVRADKYKFGARAGKYKLGASAGKYKLGARSRVGGQTKSRGPRNTTTRIKTFLKNIYLIFSLVDMFSKIHSIRKSQ